MRFQILSDVHLEFYKVYPGLDHFVNIETVADAICLCGDIGDPFSQNYMQLLYECSSVYKYVFVITGNHEYYGHHTLKVGFYIRTMCPDNVVYLDNSGYDIPDTDIRVIGTTLWSHIPESNREIVEKNLSDFRYIKDWTVDKHNRKFQKSVKFLLEEFSSSTRRILVMTHYAPVIHCGNPRYMNSPLACAYKSDLEHILTDKVVAWAYGHDHYNMRFYVGNTMFVTNQIGYQDDNCRPQYESIVSI